eukprot:325753_1
MTDAKWEEEFLSIPSNYSSRNISYKLAYQPHVAGETENIQLSSIMANMFRNWGYEIITDNITDAVLDRYIYSSLSIKLLNQTIIDMDLSNEYLPNDKDTNTTFRKRAWNAYSASGNITYPLIYVNKGETNDYTQLINAGYNLTDGYIALVKSTSNRGTLINTAASYGIKGMIMFMDRDNNGVNNTYTGLNNGIRLPPSGFQYGTIKYNTPCVGNIEPNRLVEQCGFNNTGDNYNKLFPSLYYNIPMITISSKNAQYLFNYFISNNNDGVDGKCQYININSSQWNGWISNIANVEPFCVGGNVEINLQTQNNFSPNSKIQNLFAYKEGILYPDEIVMIGSHRDAWALGACDDISGTTTMMEVARSISVMINKGWLLKRSIMFGSWDGEEWGLFGSTQFNEYRTNWTDKIISYHNLDMTVQGDSFTIMVTPLIETLLIEAQKSVLYPYPNKQRDNNEGKSTFYDYWRNDEETNQGPVIGQLNSDYGSFVYYSGIPSFETGFWGYTPTYHSFYDTNGWLDIVDPEWKYAQHIAQYAGLITLRLTQNHIIPYNVYDLYNRVNTWRNSNIPELANSLNCDITTNILHMQLLNDSLDEFQESIDIFYSNLNEFTRKYGNDLYSTKINSNRNELDSDMLESVEQFNAILTGLRNCFTLKYPYGLPMNNWFKNMLWKPGSSGGRLPFITDIIRLGCVEEEVTNAFNITASMFYKASSLLQSYH